MRIDFGKFKKWWDKESNIATFITKESNLEINLKIITTGVFNFTFDSENVVFLIIYEEITSPPDDATIGIALPIGSDIYKETSKNNVKLITNSKVDNRSDDIDIGLQTENGTIVLTKQGILIQNENTTSSVALDDKVSITGPVSRDQWKESYGIIEKNPTSSIPIPDFPLATLTNTSSLDINGIISLVKNLFSICTGIL